MSDSSRVVAIVLFRPFIALVLVLIAAIIAWPIRRAIQKHMREGRLKRFLLFSWRV